MVAGEHCLYLVVIGTDELVLKCVMVMTTMSNQMHVAHVDRRSQITKAECLFIVFMSITLPLRTRSPVDAKLIMDYTAK